MKRNISSVLETHSSSNSGIGVDVDASNNKSPKRNRIQGDETVQEVQQPSSSTTNASNSNSINSNNNEILSNLVVTMKTLQLQNQRLVHYQEKSYKWHFMHHSNIKKFEIETLNVLSENIERIAGGSIARLEPSEDHRLLEEGFEMGISSESTEDNSRGSNTSMNNSNNLHNLVKSYRAEGRNEELKQLLKRIDSVEKFRQLQDTSFEILIPLLTSMLQNQSDWNEVKTGCLLLMEGKNYYPDVFSKFIYRKYLETILQIVEKFDSSTVAYLQLDSEELAEFYNFIAKNVYADEPVVNALQ